MVTSDPERSQGVWAKGQAPGRKGASAPKGRQLDDAALDDVRAVLGAQERRRDLLIEFLHLLQDQYGHLSAPHLCALAHELKLSQAEVYEVATFYAHFDVVAPGDEPPPPLTIRVCSSLSCEMAGAGQLLSALQARYHGADAGTDAGPRAVRVLRAPCMGRCDCAPVAVLGQRYFDHAAIELRATEQATTEQPALEQPALEQPALEQIDQAVRARNTQAERPAFQDYASYCAEGGYGVLRALQDETQNVDELIDKVVAAKLRGLGGAGFPTGRKWKLVRAEPGPRYLAVNADEGEPGTFKDRYYLERTPHYCLEGMLLAAHVIGAQRVYFYLRDEYAAVREILHQEIAALEQAGLIAPGYVELRRGAGAYICGEESAMIESIEGKRGLPRHRPPYVAQAGIFDRPTLVHNVETLHWVARLCREGPELFSGIEKNGRVGLRSYSISGRVKAPGVKVLPAGSTILDIIEAAGGMCDGHEFAAYQPGGPSSGLLPASCCDVPLDFDMLQPLGSFIGSAAVVVLSNQDNVKAAALNMLRFFAHESCGQCTPCRVGCEKAVQLMQGPQWDEPLLEELCQLMADASICGLGQAAPNPIRSVFRHFADEV